MAVIERHRGGQFEVLHGVHDEGGTMYEAGEVLESDKDLDRMFPEKFKRRAGKNRRPRDHEDGPNTVGNRVMDRPLHIRLAEKKKMGKAKKKTAMKETESEPEWDEDDIEAEEKKKTRQKAGPQDDILEGEDLPEDEDDEEGIEEEEDTTESEEDDEDADEPEETDLGKDVSSKFEEARKADLRVFKGEKGYSVVDADEPDKALHNNPLPTRNSVDSFVEDYRTGDQGQKSKVAKQKATTKKHEASGKAAGTKKSKK